MTIDEIRRKKEEYRYTNEQLSKLSGVPLATVQKVMGKVTRKPRYETIRALSAVFEDSQTAHRNGESRYPANLSEPEPAYNVNNLVVAANWNVYDRQGNYSIDDYYALSEEQRGELIDGVIYDMGSPSVVHQLIAQEIFARLREHVKKNEGPCMPFMAPLDVQLNCDNRTIVEPDVMVVCDKSKITSKRIFGAPDFIIEILSKSTRRKDLTLKLYKYADAGVREYWIIDPDSLLIVVYDLEHDVCPVLYDFSSQVPVKIWNEEFSVDFQQVYNDIKDYL
ncbi:MAG: Uma2 family endonuclease [Lachnospiraceae bacterium]|nr:Uma2 family endonuclease [Lachnospiraceae bacterium]MDO4733964.1 Uma2 family endonuclease [Lachnospiraceae bacterium]